MRLFIYLFFLVFSFPVFAINFDLTQLNERLPITKPVTTFSCTHIISKADDVVVDMSADSKLTLQQAQQRCIDSYSPSPIQISTYGTKSGYPGAKVTSSSFLENNVIRVHFTYDHFSGKTLSSWVNLTVIARLINVSASKTCPHPDNPLHTYSYDSNGDGKVDYCLDPQDIALNDSVDKNCAYDSIVPDYGFKTEPDGQACIVNSANNAVCMMKKQGAIFVAGEGNCYKPDAPDTQGQDKPTPPPPSDNSCNIHFGAAIACSADPSKYCNGQGVCDDGCGYVNGSFMCFPDDCANADTCTLPPPKGGSDNGDGDSGSGDGDNGSGNGDGDSGSGNGDNGSGTDTSCTGSNCGKTNVDVEVNVDLDKLLDKGPQITKEDIKSKMDVITGDYFEEFDRVLAQTYKEAGGVEINKDNVGFGDDIAGRLDVKSSCTNPTIPIGLETHTLDICEKAPLITLMLDFIFGMMTVIYFFIRLNQVLSEGGS